MLEFDEKKKAKINAFFRKKDLLHKEQLMKYNSIKFEKLTEFTYNLSSDNFSNLKQLAISPGGFLTLEIRRKIYDKLLLLGEGNVFVEKYDFLFLDSNKSNISRNDINFIILSKGEKEIGKCQLI